MLIIVEGVDGVGKTTVATALRGMLGATLFHASQPQSDDVMSEYVVPLQMYAPVGMFTSDDDFSKTHVVCDRWHLGELVYGPLYRGGSLFTPETLAVVELFLNAQAAVVVYMTEDKDVVMGRWRSRGEDFLKLEHYDWACRQYEYIVSQTRVPVLRFHGEVDQARLHQILNVGRVFEECMANERRRFKE